MAKNKTSYTEESVTDFIAQLTHGQAESLLLIDLMRRVTTEEPKMWGSTIIGFGAYAYRYESGHGGEAPLLAFSPRKSAISLYVYAGAPEQASLLQALGKFKMGKACIYIKKLADIDEDVLMAIMRTTLSFLEETYKRI